MSDSELPEPDPEALHHDAESVLSVELPLAFRGYRIADVDALLGELALQIAASEAELARLRAQTEGSAAERPEPVASEPTTDVTPDVTAEPSAGSVPGSTDASAGADAAPTDGSDTPPAEDERPTDGSDSPTAEDERPREVTVVASGRRRRALVPSVVLVVGAIAALVVGWREGDQTAVLVSIAASSLALVGVGLAVLVTRSRGPA